MIPDTWAECEMKDVAEIVGGGTPKASEADNFGEGDGIPWITPSDLSGYRQTYIGKGKRFLSKKGLKSSSAVLLPKGTVLFSTRAPIGYVAVAANDLATNQGFRSFICKEGIVPEYVCYYLKTMKPLAEQMASGTTFLEISGTTLGTLPFVFAPTNEQQRIVEKLDELMGRLAAARAKLERVPRLLAHFRRAVLAAACSGSLTRDWREANGQGEWMRTNLRPLILNLDQGWSPKCENFPSPSPEKWGVIKTTSVQQIDFLEAENKCLPDELTPRPNLELKAGDVLITRAGPRSRAGVCCYVASVRPKLMICDKVYRVRAYLKKLDPSFLVLALNTPAMIEHIDGLKTGSSDSGLNLTQERFLTIEIDLPALPEQREIVRRVNELFALADSLEARFAKAKAFFDRLPGTLLAKAFRGELVPHDAHDEPASALLERLRNARATAPAVRSTGARPAGRTGRRGQAPRLPGLG